MKALISIKNFKHEPETASTGKMSCIITVVGEDESLEEMCDEGVQELVSLCDNVVSISPYVQDEEFKYEHSYSGDFGEVVRGVLSNGRTEMRLSGEFPRILAGKTYSPNLGFWHTLFKATDTLEATIYKEVSVLYNRINFKKVGAILLRDPKQFQLQ